MNVIELFAKFVVDTSDLNRGLDLANNKASSFASGFSNVMGVVGTVAKVATGAMVATAGAVGAVAQQASGAYSEYQQLSGGIETLFENQEAVNAVMANASNAYKTAGMSSNQYMDTVISMAASLNKATGDTVESARLADMAITDMSDNVNKMGTTMEMVENAYRGFTRGNFSMLDNLALGYAGTKEGMQELLADAQAISGVEYDISSYADIVNAIHVIQQEMGITGTTAAEAGETIQGSAGAMKAAWDNLILGLADPNADLGMLIDNMVKSAETALTNMMPTFTHAIEGIGQLVQSLAPVISNELPGLVESVLPPLLDSAATLIDGVVKALPDLLGVIAEQLPPLINTLIESIGGQLSTILQAVIDIVTQLADSLSKMLPGLITTVTQIVVDLLAVITDPKNISAIVEAAVGLLQALAQGIVDSTPVLVNAIPDILIGLVNGLVDGIGIILDAIPDIYEAIEQALLDNADELLAGVLELITTIFTRLPDLIGDVATFIGEMFTTVVDLIKQAWGDKGPEILEMVRKFLTEDLPPMAKEMGKKIPEFIEAVANFIKQMFDELEIDPEAISELITNILTLFIDYLVIAIPIVLETLTNIILAIAQVLPGLIEPIALLIPTILTTLLTVLIDNSPLLLSAIIRIVAAIVVALPGICKAIVLAIPGIIDSILMALANIIVKLEDLLIKIKDKMLEALNKLADLVIEALDFWQPIYDNAMTWLADLIVGFEDWITDIWEDITGFYDDLMLGFADWIIDIGDKFTEIVDKIKEIITGLIDEALTWGGDLVDNFVKGITDNDDLEDAVGEEGMAGTVRKFLHFSKPDEGPLADFDTYAPDMMELFAKGITDNTRVVGDAVRGAFDFGGMITGGMPTGAGKSGLITPTVSQPVQVTLVLDKQQLGKVVFDLNNQERQRVGVTLGKEAFA